MNALEKRSPKFAIIFIAALLAVSAGVFVTFTYVQRAEAAKRQKASAENLAEIYKVLMTEFNRSGKLPENSSELGSLFKGKEQLLTHPSWPMQAGYVYVAGCNPRRDPELMTLVFENVPAGKPNTPVQAIDLKGRISIRSHQDREVWLKDDARIRAQSERPTARLEMRAAQ